MFSCLARAGHEHGCADQLSKGLCIPPLPNAVTAALLNVGQELDGIDHLYFVVVLG